MASRTLAAAYHSYVDDWAAHGLDFVRGEAAGERARTSVATLIGADRSDVALIASVSAAAGLVAAQLAPGSPGNNVVIGETEYSSNHYPWRLLEGKGYEIRQVPFRNGGLEPDDIAHLLAELQRRGVVCSVRDHNLRLAVHFYNHEDDVHQITSALSEL